MDTKDLLAIVAVVLIVFGGIFVSYAYEVRKRQECVSAVKDRPTAEIQALCGSPRR